MRRESDKILLNCLFPYGTQVQEARRRANPDGYNFISPRVLLRLMALGASEQDIRQIMVENPRRFFEGS